MIGSSGQRGLLIVICSRYYVNGQGVWTTSSYNYDMWAECLDSWDYVTVAAPCLYQDPPAQAARADGPSVAFVSLGNSYGATGRLAAIPKRFLLLRRPVRKHDALVLHVPSDLTALACFWAHRFGKPYGLDVRGDQSLDADYLRARGVWGAGWMAGASLRVFDWVRTGAAAAIYVSSKLGVRYPLPDNRPVWVSSDIRLPEWWFTGPRNYEKHSGPWRIFSVGRLGVEKGYSLLLEACARLVQQFGRSLTLDLIGSGPMESKLHEQATRLGISDMVTFHGFVPWGRTLHDQLMHGDLFVLSSINEGMPRVVLEAMACGLPVISTIVGGTPEIVSSQDLVPPRDVSAMTAKLLEVLSQPDRMTGMSKRNFNRSRDFHPDKLRADKQAFYRYLRELAGRNGNLESCEPTSKGKERE